MSWWVWLLVSLIPTVLLVAMLLGSCRVSSEADQRTQVAYARARARRNPARGEHGTGQ